MDAGTEEYGDPGDESQPWSVLWTEVEAEEFLFASSNIRFWLLVSREELLGADGRKKYSGSPITVMASSDRCQPYQGNKMVLSSLSQVGMVV